MNEPPAGAPARRAAIDLLDAVLGKRRMLEDALDALPSLPTRDRAFAHMLAATVLRRLGSLDEVIQPHLRRAPPDAVLHGLRIGAAQLLLLGTAAHAAVGATVDAVRGLPKGASFTGLVNAVLRRVADGGAASLAGLDAARLDTPEWLWRSWHDAYGPAAARAIALAHAAEAALDLTLKPGQDAVGWAGRLGADLLPTGSLRLPAGTRVTELAGFEDGAWWVQDAASALPARLLGARPGEAVIDLCAAPGGKTAQLAATGARVTAVELSPQRIARLAGNLGRVGLVAEIVEADATSWRPVVLADAVLLDAPCSATGTIRRHPDIARNKRPTDQAVLVPLQDRLFAAAAAMVRPGGRLVYAVCSLQPEEGEGIVARAGGLGLAPDRIGREEMAGLEEALMPDGTIRTRPDLWPRLGGLDGFFIARFTRA